MKAAPRCWIAASINGTSTPITVNALTATSFAVSAAASQTAGAPFLVTVTAQDLFGNTANTYNGVVTLTSSDGSFSTSVTVVNCVATTTARLYYANQVTLTEGAWGRNARRASGAAPGLGGGGPRRLAAACCRRPQRRRWWRLWQEYPKRPGPLPRERLHLRARAAKQLRAQRIADCGPRGRLLIPREELTRLVSRGLGSDMTGVVIAGTGSRRESEHLAALVAANGLERRVELRGWITDEEKLRLYATCRAVYFGAVDEDYVNCMKNRGYTVEK